MTDNYEHYITRNIRAFFKRRLFSPIIYLIILAILWVLFRLSNILNPSVIDTSSDLEKAYSSKHYYVRTTFKDLYFTGYTKEQFGQTKGYYYYTKMDDTCVLVLLTPSQCEEGLPVIDEASVIGKVIVNEKTFTELVTRLAEDLEWTPKGLKRNVSKYCFSQPDYNLGFVIILFIFYFGTGIYAALCLLCYLLIIQFPFLSPTCQNLIVFGHPRKMLEEAEEELATLPQLATEDMFITEHYFILTSPYGNAVVPIQEILWIYKYSTLHKFLWYHFSISYTLNISANKHLYIHCPKNTKSDIDGIIDYLAEANHDILVGFNEENRLKVQAVQGKPLHIERWYAFLRRKV